MTKFADQLYADLIQEHGPALARTKPPTASPRPITSHRALLATGAGGLAVAATVGALVAGGGTPAYALTTGSDGTVTLAVYQAAGIAQANTKLHQLGDHVIVVPVRAGCPDISSLPAPAVSPQGHLSAQGSENLQDGSVTVNVRGVPAGDIVVVAAQTTARGSAMATRLTSPPAPGCVSLPAPPASGSGWHQVHGTGSAPALSRSS
jgi:hypothetical protein